MVERIITGELGVNTYLYNYRDNLVIIIDPGSDEDQIIEKVNSNGWKVRGIILTHGHFDHIGAILPLKNKFDIPVFIHKGDSAYIGENSFETHKEMLTSMGIPAPFVSGYFKETPEPDQVLEDNQILEEFELKVIHTPGHSKGSICLYSEGNKILFTGDTLFNGGLGRTDFPGGDYNTLVKSIDKILQLPVETIVYPGHGSETTIEREKGITQLY